MLSKASRGSLERRIWPAVAHIGARCGCSYPWEASLRANFHRLVWSGPSSSPTRLHDQLRAVESRKAYAWRSKRSMTPERDRKRSGPCCFGSMVVIGRDESRGSTELGGRPARDWRLYGQTTESVRPPPASSLPNGEVVRSRCDQRMISGPRNWRPRAPYKTHHLIVPQASCD